MNRRGWWSKEKDDRTETKIGADIGHFYICWGPGDRTIEKGDWAASGYVYVRARGEELHHCGVESGVDYLFPRFLRLSSSVSVQ